MKETRGHKRLKQMFPAAHWVRVESHINPGIHDCNGCFNGKECWVELKQFKKPKKTGLIKLDMKKKSVRDQIAWGVARRKAGGRTFYGLMVDSEFYVVPGGLTALLIEGVTYEKLKQIAVPKEWLFA